MVMFKLSDEAYEALKENIIEDSRAICAEFVQNDGKEFLIVVFHTCELMLEVLSDE